MSNKHLLHFPYRYLQSHEIERKKSVQQDNQTQFPFFRNDKERKLGKQSDAIFLPFDSRSKRGLDRCAAAAAAAAAYYSIDWNGSPICLHNRRRRRFRFFGMCA